MPLANEGLPFSLACPPVLADAALPGDGDCCCRAAEGCGASIITGSLQPQQYSSPCLLRTKGCRHLQAEQIGLAARPARRAGTKASHSKTGALWYRGYRLSRDMHDWLEGLSCPALSLSIAAPGGSCCCFDCKLRVTGRQQYQVEAVLLRPQATGNKQAGSTFKLKLRAGQDGPSAWWCNCCCCCCLQSGHVAVLLQPPYKTDIVKR